MPASTFMVSTSPLTPPTGCGCGCVPAECCLCLSANICINVSCPDWPSWLCPKPPPFISDSEFQSLVPLQSSLGTCDGGVKHLNYLYDTGFISGSTSTAFNATVQVAIFCNLDGTCSCGVTIASRCYIGGVSSPDTFTVTYQLVFLVSLVIVDGSTCAVIIPTTTSIPVISTTGAIPVPVGSLSPASITIVNGACPTLAPFTPAATKSSISLPCVHLSAEPLVPRAAFSLGLSPLRNWRECSQGFGVKGSDGRAYICGCAPWPNGGCGGCTSYNVGASQNSSGLESGLPGSAGEPNGG